MGHSKRTPKTVSANASDDPGLRLEGRARALWLQARDYDRWGLGEDAAEARVQSRALRIGAMLVRAKGSAGAITPDGTAQ